MTQTDNNQYDRNTSVNAPIKTAEYPWSTTFMREKHGEYPPIFANEIITPQLTENLISNHAHLKIFSCFQRSVASEKCNPIAGFCKWSDFFSKTECNRHTWIVVDGNSSIEISQNYSSFPNGLNIGV